MSFGLFILLLAAAGAVWLIMTLARGGDAKGSRNATLLKGVVWLGLSAALAAAKLWPLALMVLIAAGGVSLIELWRARAISEDAERARTRVSDNRKMTIAEAAAALGVAQNASADEIKAAHRKLISQIHPDKGGTDYLASKINEARERMLSQLPDKTGDEV
ncbi:MAG: DnaJ domain-containing protein [Pseudomonadota bacterium]